MGSERFEMRVSAELLARIDEARGHEPRASFVKRMLEKSLGPVLLEGPPGARGSGAWVVQPEALDASSGCPDCGGQWTRKVDVPGRFCVDCGAMEAR